MTPDEILELLTRDPRRGMKRAEILELAGYWTGLRVAVLPVRLASTPLGTSKKPGGAPNGYQSATLDLGELDAMLDKAHAERQPGETLGLAGVPATGGFIGGDFDTKNGAAGRETLWRLVDKYPDATRCRYESISGATNCWWLRPPDYPNLSNAAPAGWHGFECRDASGYLVLPGTFKPDGAWRLSKGSVLPDEAWPLPLELADKFKRAGERGKRVASSPTVAAYIAARTTYTDATRRLVDEVLETFARDERNGRHPAMVHAVSRLVGLDVVDLEDALGRVQARWDALTAGEGREREVYDYVAHVIGRQTERDAEEGTEEEEASSSSSGTGFNWDGPSSHDEDQADAGARRASVVELADVEPEPVEWVWAWRIPRGCLTILDGDPSIGKSTLAIDLAARVSRGGFFPPLVEGGSTTERARRGTVVLLTAEDDLANTVRPRLDAAKADSRNVVAITGTVAGEGDEVREGALSLPRDLELLEAVIRDRRALLVVVDVFAAYTQIKGDAHRDADIRSDLLAPLAALARRTRAAILLLRHLTKAHGGNPLYAGGGSIAITGAARSVLLAGVDPQNPERRVLAVAKANLSPVLPSLAYTLENAPNGRGRIEWHGETEADAGDLLRPPERDRQPTPRERCVEWLRGELAEGPVRSAELKADALERYSVSTYRRAREELGVRSKGPFVDDDGTRFYLSELPPFEGAHEDRGDQG